MSLGKHLYHYLLKPLLRISLGLLIGIPLVLYPFLYFNQENLLFHPQSLPEYRLQQFRQFFAKAEINWQTPDGERLHGWFYQPDTPGPHPLMIYFGGNAEEITPWLHHRQHFPDYALLLVNYRSYGLSTGQPSEAQFYQDAVWLYDQAMRQAHIDPQRVLVVARSLGTGIATYLAAQRPVCGAVLISPYDSIQAISQRVYPYVPIAWLLKHPFKAIDFAPHITAPMLALVAAEDTLIPLSHSQNLATAWAGPTQFSILPDMEHNDIHDSDQYWPSIEGFVQSICKG